MSDPTGSTTLNKIRMSDLLEPRELVEEHAEHHLVGLWRQVGEEEDLVGRGVVHSARSLGRHNGTRRTRLQEN